MIYNWKRYWYRRGDRIKLNHNGYLNLSYGNKIGEHIFQIESILNKSCIILMGEQGSGKSTILEKAYEDFLLTSKDDNSVHILFVELASILSKEALNSKIKNTKEYKEWIHNNKLILYLDSFDEAYIQQPAIELYLADFLREHKPMLKRLEIKMTCRVGLWSKELERSLIKLFDEKSFEVYELAPLAEDNVKEAVENNGLSYEVFIEELISKNLMSLATKPLTLKFLIENFVSGKNRLPESRAKIYDNGCRSLINEETKRRQMIKTKFGMLDDNKVMTYAAVLGMLSVFCGKHRISLGNGLEMSNPEILCPSEIRVMESSLSIDFLNQVLATGLFKGSDTNCVTWVHYSFAEYLAAVYLNKHFDKKRIMNLLIHPNCPNHTLVPQLHGVSGWLAEMNDEIFDAILEVDHNVLFLSNFIGKSDVQKEKFLEAYLNAYNEPGQVNTYSDWTKYKFLSHKNIENQLRAFIENYKNDRFTIRKAIEIVEICHVNTIRDAYFEVSKHIDEYTFERAMCYYCENADKSAMKRLNCREDVLEECSPKIFTAIINKNLEHKIFEVTSLHEYMIKYKKWYGEEFLYFNMLTESQIDDLLGWCIGRFENEKKNHFFVKFIDYIIVYVFINGFNQLYKEKLDMLISLCVEKRGKVLSHINYAGLKIDETMKIKLLKFSYKIEKQYIDLDILSHMKELMHYSKKDNFREDIIKLKDELVDDYLERLTFREHEKKNSIDKYYHSPLANRAFVIEMVNKIEFDKKGILKTWVEFNKKILRSNMFRYRHVTEIEKFNMLFAIEECNGIVDEAALIYLEQCIITQDDWKSAYSDEADAGLSALNLLYYSNTSKMDALDKFTWLKWAPVILYFPYSNINLEKDYPNLPVLKKAIAMYPVEYEEKYFDMIKYFNTIEDLLNKTAEHFMSNDFIEKLFNYVQYLGNTSLKNSEILLFLIKKSHTKSIEYTKDKVVEYKNSGNVENAAEFAYILISSLKDAGWQYLWNHIEVNKEFGVELFKKISREYSGMSNIIYNPLITSQQIKDFYLWIIKNWNKIEVDDSWRYHMKSTREAFISGILKKDPVDALEALNDILKYYPDETDVKAAISMVKSKAYNKLWVPIKTEALKKMKENALGRVVESAPQLREAIQESLDRLQQKLYGETPMVISLWNGTDKKGGYSPKDENEFSNYIKVHLDDDLNSKGVIVNREVEISRGYGDGKGSRTDIHVNAFCKEPRSGVLSKLTFIIEVKGCWHNKVNTAMKKQLVEDYLKKHCCNDGMYLVGWFYCNQWKVKKETVDQARMRFDKKANELSISHKVNVCSYVMETGLK